MQIVALMKNIIFMFVILEDLWGSVGHFMSKLIKKTIRKAQQSVITLPLSSDDVETHIEACKKITMAYVESALAVYLKAFLNVLMAEVDNANSTQESSEWLVVHRLVKSKHKEIKHQFYAHVMNSFKAFNVSGVSTFSSIDKDINPTSNDHRNLRLVDKHIAEENTIITAVVRHVDAKVSEPLRMLNQRFSVLKPGGHIEDKDNPVAPIQFCYALQEALVLLPSGFKVKKLAYASFAKVLLPFSFKLLDAINGYLQKQGILPNMTSDHNAFSESLINVSKDNDKSHAVEEVDNQVHIEREDELIKKIHTIQDDRANRKSLNENDKVEAGNSESISYVISTELLVERLKSLHIDKVDLARALLNWNGKSIPVSDVLTHDLIELLRMGTRTGEIKHNDMHVINLVGMLFSYMLNDEHLPASVKSLLSYLHVPFLKIAFIDRDFFEQSQHPARLLLNNLAEAGVRWVNDDGSAEFDMFDRMKDVVMQIYEATENEVKLVTELLLDFRSNMKQVQRKQEIAEKREKEKARGENRLHETKIRVNTEIQQRIQGKELPSSVLLFLLQPWTDYLSFISLRHGDTSESWEAALHLVDELIWCSEPKKSQKDQERLAKNHQPLLNSIGEGLDHISFPEYKKDNLISAVSSVIELSLKKEKPETVPLPIRNELERKAAEKAGETPIVDDEPTKEEIQMTENLKVIEFGTWLEFDGSRRLKVAWHNSRNGEYMLVNQMGQRAEMMLPLALARLMLAGKVKVISGSSKPFFERALENIYEKLNSSS